MDWIVVGGGITGAALAYELVKVGFSVQLIEQHPSLQGASRYTYGGLSYWAGNTDLTKQLFAAGIDRHRELSAELEADTEFRILNLLLTINPDQDPHQIAANYAQVAIPPKVLTVQEACEMEPLLNQEAIAGALVFPHGQIETEKTCYAYWNAFQRLGGKLVFAQVTELVQQGNHIRGVKTVTETYQSDRLVVAAGGWTRNLLQAAEIPVKLYFSHAELIETSPVNLKLQTIVMPGITTRFELEAKSSTPELDPLWETPGQEVVPPILDAGAVQLKDGRIRIGQISRTLTDPFSTVDASESEASLRREVGRILPKVGDLPGTWHDCLVAYSRDRLPLVGEIAQTGVYIFSGFSNPLVVIPHLAQRFANFLNGQPDSLMSQLSPDRFTEVKS